MQKYSNTYNPSVSGFPFLKDNKFADKMHRPVGENYLIRCGFHFLDIDKTIFVVVKYIKHLKQIICKDNFII